MKKFVLSIIIAAGGLITQNAAAQVGVNVGLRIGPLVINVHKPIAPAVVYDDFYYLPEVDAYYSVPERCYYYMDGGGRWVNAAYLPGRYHDYDWRTARRYEVRAQRPYANHDYYRNKYNGNRGGNWGNDQYAYRGPQGRDDRGNYGGRLPSSPYDSNNAGGRGGYTQPNGNNDNRGNWNNGQGRDNNDRGNGRNGSNQPDRNQGGGNQSWGGQQGGNNGNTNWQPGRGGNNQNGYGKPNQNNGQPSNQNGGRDNNNNWQPNRNGNNQPASQNDDRNRNRGGDNRSNMPERMHFSRNMVESNGRMQVAGN